MNKHTFFGKWITDSEFAALQPRNVFHRQKDKMELPEEHLNAHILFRHSFDLGSNVSEAQMYITADDFYKLYINGRYVAMGPAPSYHLKYGYNCIDVKKYLQKGRNVIAVHTLYQGLINRVWQSGDFRHGLIFDLVCDGVTVAKSDETTLTHRHTAYSVAGRVGYDTQFLENYDSRAPECFFDNFDFDDSSWERAHYLETDDHLLSQQTTKQIELEYIQPVRVEKTAGGVVYDFGQVYVGYPVFAAKGNSGEVIGIRCAQEKNDDGSVRYNLRANCVYSEEWVLSGGCDVLDQFDYKAFRFVELSLPDGAEIIEAYLLARHYPFELKVGMREEYASDEKIRKVWDLAVNSQRWGVQEVIMDCMEREKGFYVGDGCYTALAHAILTGDDSIARKLIDDAFLSTFITEGMVTCLDCSFMQEIAEYPLMLTYFILWHYRVFGDKAYLAETYPRAKSLLESYRAAYECEDGLLRDLDKWCVVEWPDNYRDGYDVNITEGTKCTTAHVSINAYYIEAVHTLNLMAKELNIPRYRDEGCLRDAFNRAFYRPERKLYRDGVDTEHISLVGNIFPYAFNLSEDEGFYAEMEKMIEDRGIHSVSMFTSFPMMMGLCRRKKWDLLRRQLVDEGAWLRTVREDSRTTFEGWGKDCKWNTSLFHMTMSDVAIFLADGVNLEKLFEF